MATFGHCKSLVLFNHGERGCEALQLEEAFVWTDLLLTTHFIHKSSFHTICITYGQQYKSTKVTLSFVIVIVKDC